MGSYPRNDEDYYRSGGDVPMPEHENHTPLTFTHESEDKPLPMEVRMMIRMLQGAMVGLDTYPETNDVAAMAKAHVEIAMKLMQHLGKTGE